jgi:ribosomal protein S18 acetylase RimI-like enzyme
VTHRSETSHDVAVSYGTAAADDMESAARLYLETFPGRLEDVCGSRRGAESFCVDLMDLMRLSFPDTFFTAHSGGGLAGYLVLTVPGRSIVAGMFRRGFVLRAAGRLMTGRYGSPLGIVRRAMSRARARPEDGEPADLHVYPHVYVVAVGSMARGRGIGARLLLNARQAVENEFPRLWLSVDIDNTGAVRFYERMGLRTVATGRRQQHMVWDFDEKVSDPGAG